jgi:MYXO-CTERM domain-containing protein
MSKSVSTALLTLMMVLGVAGRAFAGQTTAPEIDGSTLSAGLGLLAAGVLIVRSRRRVK